MSRPAWRASWAVTLLLWATSAAAQIPAYDAAKVARDCEAGLAQAKTLIARMGAKQGGAGFFGEWNRLQIAIEDVVNPIYLMGSVHPDKAVRDAADPCIAKFTSLSTDIFQDERLFRRLQGTKPANPRQAKLRKDLIEGFEDSGIALPPERRRRAKEIFDRLELLRQEYDRAVREDATTVTFSPAEMAGLPEPYLQAQKRDSEGRYLLGLDYPAYVPFMTRAENGEARKRYQVAKLREGGPENIARLDEMYLLRKELATLHGLESFAHYSLRRKMAGTPEAVNRFLAEVKDAVSVAERLELAELRAAKAKAEGISPEAASLNRWDIHFWQERIRQDRYAIDQERLRRHFPTRESVAFSMRIASTLYGIEFREKKVPTWHPDVRYFDVIDSRTRSRLGGIYLDLFPREGKYGHAAAFPVRGASTLERRLPLSALVTNFNRDGLDHEELETLLHEFGHILHGVLSRTEYVTHAGTSTTVDFVEAPSQMFEAWARREQALALFASVCPACPALSREEIDRLEAARRFGSGLRYARQASLARFDMALSTAPEPALALWKRIEADSPLGHTEGTLFPASFSHIASNYAAGYYGYLWSEVLAADMLSAFGNDLLDPRVGRRYREAILSQGGQAEPGDLVRRFLGREPSREPFFADLARRPQAKAAGPL